MAKARAKKKKTDDQPEERTAVIIDHPTIVRGPIELKFNAQRKEIEDQYDKDLVDLQTRYHSKLLGVQNAKRDAYIDAGLNPDGSTPVDYGVSNS